MAGGNDLPTLTFTSQADWETWLDAQHVGSRGVWIKIAKKATGADYALYTWVRDGYASAERQATMAAIAILSLGRAIPGGGQQTAYASLVDLNSGRILWFNRIQRGSGDLRDADRAEETLDTLLAKFPAPR